MARPPIRPNVARRGHKDAPDAREPLDSPWGEDGPNLGRRSRTVRRRQSAFARNARAYHAQAAVTSSGGWLGAQPFTIPTSVQ